MKKLVIITGVSQGIGNALARYFIDQSFLVWGIGRRDMEEIQNDQRSRYRFWERDLSDVESMEKWTESCLNQLPENLEELYFIHNAGTLEPMHLTGHLDEKSLISSIQLNLTSVMILSNVFIRKTQSQPIRKRILVISSGAGKNPYIGWAAYCSTKAGVDMFVRVMAEEQQTQEFPVEVISFAPGIVDTAMQEKIRATPKEQFPMLDKFVELKEQGLLAHPADVAPVIFTYLTQEKVENGIILDIRDL
ncbi:MAG: (S)-benzoin forming benzil reductase [Spirosomataceae bacterium]